MAQLGTQFNANDVEPSAPIEVIQAGNYLCSIVSSDMLDTSNNSGQYLKLEFVVLEGQYANRHLWSNLNLINSNPQTVEIAQRDLSAICHATGQMMVSDSEQLHNKPMIVTVKVRPAGPDKKGVYREAQNELKGYSAPNKQRAPVVSQPSTMGQEVAVSETRVAQQPQAPKTAPWRKAAAA